MGTWKEAARKVRLQKEGKLCSLKNNRDQKGDPRMRISHMDVRCSTAQPAVSVSQTSNQRKEEIRHGF